MCSKRLLAALTAIFALFVLTGCGNEPIASVNEEDYYPRFEVKADNVSHSIFRDYANAKECENDLDAFKNKGDYYEDLLRVTRDDPLGDGTIEIAEISKDCYSYSHIYLNILDDNITRNNELFEKIFGYKGGELTDVFVTKRFSENDAIDYIETYIKLLEKQGFKKQLTSYFPWKQTVSEWLNDVEWVKSDFATGTKYYWNYSIEWGYGDDYTDKKVVGLSVYWHYN
jgi:hypothetical protein